MQKGFIFILILVIITGIFAVSNSGAVPVNFIFTEVLVSQAIVIFISVLLGAIITSIFAQVRQMSLNKDIKQLQEENKTFQSDVYKLKTQIKDKEEDGKSSDTKNNDNSTSLSETNKSYKN